MTAHLLGTFSFSVNDATVQSWPTGKGRAVLLPWGTYMGCFPLAEDNQPVQIRDYQEYYASAIIRALLWAANRASPVALNVSGSLLPSVATICSAVTAVPTIAKIGTPILATHGVSKSITVVLTMPPVFIL